MIQVTMSRDKDGQHYDQGSREMSPLDALRILTTSELAFGGNITEASGTQITIITRVMGCVDTSIFAGSQEEMRPLNEAAYYYLRACERETTVMDGVLAELARMPNGAGGNPLILSLAAPMVMGRNRLALAAMLALGISAEGDIAAGMLMGLEDLFAAFQLMQEFPHMSLADVSAAVAT